jgi:4-amino-4-deoxy-L-arabinose transferase-like glycosyltransferase
MSDETQSKETEQPSKAERDRDDGRAAKNGVKGQSAVAEAVAQHEAAPESGEDGEPSKPAAKTREKPKRDEKDDEEKEENPLLAKGNPLRKWRGGLTAGIASFIAFLLMAHNGQLAIAVPMGTLLMAIAAWGVMDLLGTFDDPEDRVVASASFSTIRGPLLGAAAMFVFFAGSVAGAASGVFSQIGWGCIVTVAFIAFVVSLYRVGVVLGPWKKDELGLDRPLVKRHGFWLLVAGAVLYFPTLGIFSLWDPWETHYGEVAREILARDDWISLWWAQDGWFWSKPILNFWIQALAMSALGAHYKPDLMLQGSGGPTAHPEWIVRTPNVLMTLLAMYLFYKGVSKVFGRRAGFLGGLVLATMPDWYFLAHQTMTDMPFVAAMTSAMGLLLLGLNTKEEDVAKLYEIKLEKATFRLSGWHLAFGAILLCAIPQILYLLSRNIELVVHGNGPYGFRVHWDEFRSGSGGGNCGLPGNEACATVNPASIPRSVGPRPEGIVNQSIRLFGGFEPVVQALLWSAILGFILYLNWGERRVRRLYYIGAWFFAAVATMAKGPAGFAIPAICAFAYIATKKRWAELGKLEMLSGLLIILGVALPWYVAMYVRHGSPFTDRLIFHDMFNRAFSHVHDTNEGDDTSFRFYLWQLGYALFPWTGLAPLGLLWWARRSDAADKGKGDASVFLVMWFIFGFALFSFMGTKFHHYIFPAVPPVAMLIGVVLDEMLEDGPRVAKGSMPMYLAGVGGGLGLVVIGVSRFWPGSMFGTKNGSELPAANSTMGLVLLAAGLATVVMAMRFFSPKPEDEKKPAPASKTSPDGTPYRGGLVTVPEPEAVVRRRMHEQLMLAGSFLAGAMVLVLVGRDLAIKAESSDQPGAIRLLQLFTYNYRRPWPDSLDFSAVLSAFAVVAVILSVALAIKKIRPHMTAAFLAFSFVWAVWGLDVYMMKTSPHWGQHEVIEAYYASRKGPEEPLIAYQMNWKGENFYTSNKIPAFVSSGQPFTNWVKKEKEKGTKVMYFITEHNRTSGLRSEVGARSYREVTDKVLCNKFVLVRAEL